MVYRDVLALSISLSLSPGYLSLTSERHMLASLSVFLREQSPSLPLPLQVLFPTDAAFQ